MKVLTVVLAALFISASGIFYYREPISQKIDQAIYFSFCDKPISFKIGSIDPRFDYSKENFTKNTIQAAQIWNNLENKKLFIYDRDEGFLTVNLIFDERQGLRNQITGIQSDLKNKKETIKPGVEEYEIKAAGFKQKLAELNSQIADWNAKGGAPPEVYEQLTKKQQELKQEADSLNNLAKQLNISADSYNAQVTELNQTIDTFNQTLKQKPEEGVFDPVTNTIQIYFNINQNELTHTLTHELGHALGLVHNQNPKSIMYPFTTQMLVPTNEDKAAVNDLCRKQNKLEVLKNNLQIIINYYMHLLNLSN